MTTELSCFLFEKNGKKQLHNKLTITKFTKKLWINNYCDSSINRRKGTLNKH